MIVLVGLIGMTAFVPWACEKRTDRSELVRINDVSITLEEFRELSERRSLEEKMRLLSEKGSRDFLENYVVAREVLYQEAKKKGYDQKKEIIEKVEDFKRAMAIDALLEEALRGKSEVTESDVQAYYKENQGRFTEAREIKIRHIVVPSEAVLREVVAKLSRGENFETLASLYNIDRTRGDGGNLGFLRRGQLSPLFAQFEEAAFLLKNKGDISEVVRTPYGFHLIRLEDKRGASVRPLDQVRDKIRAFLQTKKRQDSYLEYVKEAKSRATITINEALWAEEEKKEIVPQEKDETKAERK